MGSIPAWDGMGAEGMRRGARPHALECPSPEWGGRRNGLSVWSLHVLPMPPGGYPLHKNMQPPGCFCGASSGREGRLFGGRGTGRNSVILPRAMSCR